MFSLRSTTALQRDLLKAADMKQSDVVPNNLDALGMNQTARRSRCKSILFSSSRSILSRPLSPRALGSQEGGTQAADDVLGRPCASTDREIHRVDVDSLHNYAVSVLTSIPKQPPPLLLPSLTPNLTTVTISTTTSLVSNNSPPTDREISRTCRCQSS